MATATDIRNTPRREDGEILRGLKDLESPINEAAIFARLAANLADNTLALDQGEKVGEDFYRFTLSKTQLEDMAFLAGEAQYRAGLLREAFYGAVRGEAA